MTNKKQQSQKLEIIDEQLVWDGFVSLKKITANIPSVRGGNINIVREVHDHGNAVTVLPVDKQRKTALLVSQWRVPAYVNGHHNRILEAPAGLIDAGETPEECAKREAIEETGYAVSNLRFVSKPFASPGLVTEQVYIFLGDYTPDSRQNSEIGIEEEGEDLELFEMPFEKLFQLLKNGELFDAVTIIAIYALKDELEKDK